MSALRNLMIRAVPSVLRRRLVSSYATVSYAQHGEDIIIAELLRDVGDRPGFYVDVGAYHPQQFSNTYAFYCRGWRGLNIDAMPGSMVAFRQMRSRDINVEAAVSTRRGKINYYIFEQGALNGFSPTPTVRDSQGREHRAISTVEVQAVPLAELLSEHVPSGQDIDFMSVDVEGADYDVLFSNDWKRFRPRVILAEQIGFRLSDPVKVSPVASLLHDHGYVLSCKTPYTLVFERDDVA